MANSTVLYEVKDHIAYVTMNRPAALNAYNRQMLIELEKVWEEVKRDSDVHVAILTGSGDKAFSSGADIKELAAGIDVIKRPDGTLIQTLPTDGPQGLGLYKPIIAAVNGYCLAGGLDIAIHCDILIAADHAKFGLSMVKLHLTPGAACPWLIHLIPLSYAMQLALTGDTINAQEAYRIGLVNQVVPLTRLMPTAEAMARSIIQNGPSVAQATKQTILRCLNTSLDQGMFLSTLLYREQEATNESSEAIKGFVEKRGTGRKVRSPGGK